VLFASSGTNRNQGPPRPAFSNERNCCLRNGDNSVLTLASASSDLMPDAAFLHLSLECHPHEKEHYGEEKD
jgi:hypothetical protein